MGFVFVFVAVVAVFVVVVVVVGHNSWSLFFKSVYVCGMGDDKADFFFNLI